MKIHIINGPNLNLLGVREPEIYGKRSFGDFMKELKHKYPDISLAYFQSNHEGAIIDYLHEAGFDSDGIILNAGALAHQSIALADAVKAIQCPVIEVHISNVHAREAFRHHSYISAASIGQITGLGLESYQLALDYFIMMGQ
jgi:3-dehydroquinate dehydratase-2